MKPKQSMMGALHGFLAGAADAAPRLEARAHLGPSGAQHEPVQPTERAWGGRSRVARPGRIQDSLRAAGAFSRKIGGYSDKGAFCLSSYNTLMSPLKVDPTQTRP